MSKIDINHFPTKLLFEPFTLIRKFELPPELVLNPIFDEIIRNFDSPYASRKYDIREIQSGHVLKLDFKDSNGKVEEAYRITYNRGEQNPIGVETICYKQTMNSAPEENILKYDRDRVSLGENNSLIRKHTTVDFVDKETALEEDVRDISVCKMVYDQNGVLDFVRHFNIPSDEFIEITDLNFLNLQFLYSKLEEYEKYLDKKLLDIHGSLACGSYEIERHPEFIEKATFIEKVCDLSIKMHTVPLFNSRINNNNLYGMHYVCISEYLNPEATYEKLGPYGMEKMMELQSNKNYQSKVVPTLTAEELRHLIDYDETNNQITRSEMQRRAGKRLSLNTE